MSLRKCFFFKFPLQTVLPGYLSPIVHMLGTCLYRASSDVVNGYFMHISSKAGMLIFCLSVAQPVVAYYIVFLLMLPRVGSGAL